MKKIFFKCNVIGMLCMLVGIVFILFNLPLHVWFILLGAGLIAAGIFLCK